jgi:hypothetical protein
MSHHDVKEIHHASDPRPRSQLKVRLVVFLVLPLTVLTAACALNREPSRTPRTAIEQLLLMHAAQRSLSTLSLPIPEDAALFIQVTGLSRLSYPVDRGLDQEGLMLGPPTDLSYVREVVTGRLGEMGFRIADREDNADYLVKIIVHALGTEQGESLVGLPQVSVLGFALPEIALFKAQNQIAHARFSLDIYERPSNRFLRSTPIYTGDAFHNQYTVFFIFSFRRTDLIQAP